MCALLYLVIFVVAVAVAGFSLSSWVWRNTRVATVDRATTAELWLSGTVMTFAVALGIGYVSALTGHFRLGPVLCLACTIGAASSWAERGSWIHRLKLPRKFVVHRNFGWSVVVAIPMLAWLTFVLWRGETFFVLNHDGLAYHMPRAQMFVQTGAFGPFFGTDGRLTWPASYEILLAEDMLTTGTDTFTAWVGTVSYVALLLGIAAMTERWWGRGLHVLVVVLVLAAMPVLILHASAHKNDLLMAFFSLCLVHFVSRWAVAGGLAPLVLTIVSSGLVLGTKITGVFLGPGCALVFAAGLFRGFRARRELVIRRSGVIGTLCSVGLAFLIGPVNYLVNALAFGRAIVPAEGNNDTAWGQLSNVWQFAYLATVRPFSFDHDGIVVPWSGERWFWPDTDIYFNTWGVACSLAILAFPVVVVLTHRAGQPGARERTFATFIALTAGAGILGIHETPPHGFFVMWLRCILFVPVALTVWSLGGGLALLRVYGVGPAVQRVSLVLALALFAYNDVDVAQRDRCGNVAQFYEVLIHPELARSVWGFRGRAASIVDGLAGPRDSIAMDGAFDAWMYPAFGADRTRKVTILPHGTTPVPIPDDVDWVIVDRSWSCWFGNPKFKTLGDWWERIGHGKPTEADLVVKRQLARDPRFRLVYDLRQVNQAVFVRVNAVSAAAQAFQRTLPPLEARGVRGDRQPGAK